MEITVVQVLNRGLRCSIGVVGPRWLCIAETVRQRSREQDGFASLLCQERYGYGNEGGTKRKVGTGHCKENGQWRVAHFQNMHSSLQIYGCNTSTEIKTVLALDTSYFCLRLSLTVWFIMVPMDYCTLHIMIVLPSVLLLTAHVNTNHRRKLNVKCSGSAMKHQSTFTNKNKVF